MGEQTIEMVDLPPLFPHLPLEKVIFERFVPHVDRCAVQKCHLFPRC